MGDAEEARVPDLGGAAVPVVVEQKVTSGDLREAEGSAQERLLPSSDLEAFFGLAPQMEVSCA